MKSYYKNNKNIEYKHVRTRFPPSPTGSLHLGSARTAIFNWLFAKHYNGSFVFRLEDTDQERSKILHVKQIIEAMKWLGLEYDDGPYFQTDRFNRYIETVNTMLLNKSAYWCNCPPKESVDITNNKCNCRDLKLKKTQDAVVRFRSPLYGKTIFKDVIKGEIVFDNSEIKDFTLLRSNGAPTYHLAVVVDDIDMNISHIIRGDDHISNTPKQILLYNALNSKIPIFAHIPMILDVNRNKLSKRHGAISVLDFRDRGYLPEALMNSLARLGWSHGNQEIFTKEELIKYFDLNNVGNAASIFDIEKLQWINKQYIKKEDSSNLKKLVIPFLERKGIKLNNKDIINYIPMTINRSNTIQDISDILTPLLHENLEIKEGPKNEFLVPNNVYILKHVINIINNIEIYNISNIENSFKILSKKLNLKLGDIAQPVRVSLTGRTSSPGIFEVINILGKENVLKRLNSAVLVASNNKM